MHPVIRFASGMCLYYPSSPTLLIWMWSKSFCKQSVDVVIALVSELRHEWVWLRGLFILRVLITHAREAMPLGLGGLCLLSGGFNRHSKKVFQATASPLSDAI